LFECVDPICGEILEHMNVFVAGGTGVLGRPSLKRLVEAGYRVRATARAPEKSDLVRMLGAEPIEVNLYDQAAVQRAVRGSDVIIRLTTKIGSFSAMRKERAWEETNRLRTKGAQVLVDAAIAENVRVYIHESVVFVYANGGENWLTEESPVESDRHSRVLLAALKGENEAARFTQAGGHGIVLRFGGFYGPEAPSSTEMISMAQRRMLAKVGPGSNYFSSIYVADAARAVAAAIELPAGIYNACDDEPLRFSEYVRIVAESVGARKPLRLPGLLGRMLFGDSWKYLSSSRRVSNAKLKAASNWIPLVRSAREGWPTTAHNLSS
jgi:nucleoside-diphosphate-sugar epimerase